MTDATNDRAIERETFVDRRLANSPAVLATHGLKSGQTVVTSSARADDGATPTHPGWWWMWRGGWEPVSVLLRLAGSNKGKLAYDKYDHSVVSSAQVWGGECCPPAWAPKD